MPAILLDMSQKYVHGPVLRFRDRSGDLSHWAFTRRVAFITGSMATTAAAMLLVGCTLGN